MYLKPRLHGKTEQKFEGKKYKWNVKHERGNEFGCD